MRRWSLDFSPPNRLTSDDDGRPRRSQRRSGRLSWLALVESLVLITLLETGVPTVGCLGSYNAPMGVFAFLRHACCFGLPWLLSLHVCVRNELILRTAVAHEVNNYTLAQRQKTIRNTSVNDSHDSWI